MKKVKSRSGKAGLPPGSLVGVGDISKGVSKITLFTFNNDVYEEKQLITIGDLQLPDPSTRISWLDIDGLDDDKVVTQTGERFNLHPLLLEDVLNTDHRPKVEEYQDTLFVVVKMLSLDEETGGIENEQVSFVLGKGYLLSFQDKPGDILDPIRDRIRHKLGRVRKSGADYLLYALLDVIVDNYFLIVEELGKRIEALERKVTVRPTSDDLHTMQELRGMLITVSRYVAPTRELAGRLNTIQSELFDKSTRRYINDLQDHTVYISETIGTLRDMLASLENTYHALLNLRSGHVIKVLTIISSIFIPLTFIVGVYGMNFDNMPELRWHFGYYTVMAFMAVVAVAMLIWFRVKKWL
ncbi:MAG: magnesium/cobalt transporter CorA [Flavobacteriales bacterium]|nr:magnesium/cobalt transporter CorA [Flavobacteriales bacterium]